MTGALFDADTMWGLLAQRAAASPDAPMLLDDADRRLTFAEFKARAERVAAGLAAMGVGRRHTGHLAAADPDRDGGRSRMALARLGAVQNPIIPIYREREVGFAAPPDRRPRCSSCPAPGAASTTRPMAETSPGGWTTRRRCSSPTTPCPKATRRRSRRRRRAPAMPIRWIYYTSGTTSDPKGVAAHRRDAARRRAGAGGGAGHLTVGRRFDRLPVRAHRRTRLPGQRAHAAGSPPCCSRRSCRPRRSRSSAGSG